MTSNSMQLEVADSLLNDVLGGLGQMDSLDRQHQREKLAKELFKDVGRAFVELNKAAAQGEDVTYTRAKAHGVLGQVFLNVAFSPEIESTFTTVIHNKQMRKKYGQAFVNKWAGQALDEFNKSLRVMPTQGVHYQAGMALYLLERKVEAQTFLEKAQQGDDRETAMEAAKTITRMNEKKGGCFVATACYGSYDHPDVLVFRRWRDDMLMPSTLGRAFVDVYYRFSPPLANRVRQMPRLSGAIRRFVLEPLARKIK